MSNPILMTGHRSVASLRLSRSRHGLEIHHAARVNVGTAPVTIGWSGKTFDAAVVKPERDFSRSPLVTVDERNVSLVTA